MNASAFPFARTAVDTVTDDVLQEALRDCARHSVPALRRIYDLTAPRMLGLLLQMLGDREEAESMLQHGYVAIWQQAASFNPARSRPQTWLLSIFRQQAIDHLRAQQRVPEDEVDAALRLAETALDAQHSPVETRLLRLAYVTGRSPQDIARALDQPALEVRRGIRQALLALHAEPAT